MAGTMTLTPEREGALRFRPSHADVADVENLLSEIDRLRENLSIEQHSWRWEFERADRLEQAIRDALNELGIPGPGYPVPVTNAIAILRAAVEEGKVTRQGTLGLVLDDLRAELSRAQNSFDPIASPHEGWAVIREEVDELWELVKANEGRDGPAMHEALQVATMAVRYILDLGRDS